jgi:hypothetical protein
MDSYPVALLLLYDTTHKDTHITQNNTTLKQNAAHKATQTIKDTLHTLNTTHK